jgi:hypothetical protein
MRSDLCALFTANALLDTATGRLGNSPILPVDCWRYIVQPRMTFDAFDLRHSGTFEDKQALIGLRNPIAQYGTRFTHFLFKR